MRSLKKSRAFSLLELIVSIVVIGIVATTLPFILQTSTQSMKTTAKEELFYQEFSLLQLVNTLFFDENNTKEDNFYKDLNATEGDSELLIYKYGKDELNRIGKHQMNNNDLRSGTNWTVSRIGVDEGEDENNDSTFDDIDDYNGFSETLSSYGNVVLHVSVKYIDDNATYSDSKINFNFDYSDINHTSNIKLITVSANVDSMNISISYPTMNIGASKFLSLEEISK